jgi:predicted lipid-binding transport protein (Tim44 family)
MKRLISKFAIATVVLAAIISLLASLADARIGGGRSSYGSRGSRTWSAPAIPRTAPKPAQTMQRSTTPQAGAPDQPGFGSSRYGQPGSAGGFFRQPGFFGGLATGLLGAGLLGMLFGHGFFGVLTGGGSILGLLLQLGLIFFLVRWAMRAFSGAGRPAFAGGPSERPMTMEPSTTPARRFEIPSIGGTTGSGDRGGVSDELGIPQSDLDTFESLLGAIQEAYGREDIATLRRHTTPEMLSYLVEELTENASRGVINRVSNIRLLQGDVAESWSEGDTDYVTVAMRYSLDDVTEDRATGQVIQIEPSEATELWTFRRSRGGEWLLSALQQA